MCLRREEYRERPVRLDELLESTIDRVRNEYPDAELAFETDGDRSVAVAADDALRSVFENRLRNAVQHNDQRTPRVTVTTETDPETVTVRVADNGRGLSEPIRPELGEPGQKGAESAGSGLGLYLVETLVDRYGGEVRVEPNEPEGTVFGVELDRYAGVFDAANSIAGEHSS